MPFSSDNKCSYSVSLTSTIAPSSCYFLEFCLVSYGLTLSSLLRDAFSLLKTEGNLTNIFFTPTSGISYNIYFLPFSYLSTFSQNLFKMGLCVTSLMKPSMAVILWHWKDNLAGYKIFYRSLQVWLPYILVLRMVFLVNICWLSDDLCVIYFSSLSGLFKFVSLSHVFLNFHDDVIDISVFTVLITLWAFSS